MAGLDRGDEVRRIVCSYRADLRLAEADAWLDAGTIGTPHLLVASSITAAAELGRRATWRHGASFGWRRTTLPLLTLDLARPLLAARGLAPASPIALDAVSTRTVARLQRDGHLGRFSSVSGTAGFPRAVSRTMRDLRLAIVDSERLPADLAVASRTWDAELADAGLADEASLLRLAIEHASTGGQSDRLGVPTIWSDLRLRSPLEVELLAAVARRSPRILALVPAGDARALDGLRSALETEPETLLADLDDPLARLQHRLFDEGSAAPSPPGDSVELFSAPGEDRECVEIVRRILALASSGTALDRIAILLRAPNPYRLHLEEALARAEVPSWWVQGSRMPDPAGRALLALLACRAEDYSARRFSEYLSLGEVPAVSSTVSPEDPGSAEADREDAEDGALRVPRRWEQLLNDAAVIGGLDRWRRRLAGLEATLQAAITALADDGPRKEREERRLRQLSALRSFAIPLLERLERLPLAATWREWLTQLGQLAETSLRDPERVLVVLRELYPLGPVGPVGLNEVRLVLAPHLRDLSAPPPSRRGGRVFVGFVDAARGMEFDVVFVPGLAERGFPQRVAEDPLLLDRLRADLAPLETNDDRVEDERLQLRLAVGAAVRRICLSWPRLEVDAVRPRVPSFYALEALRAAEGVLPPLRDLTMRADRTGAARIGWPAPTVPSDAIDDAEFDLAFLGSLLEGAPRGSARWLLEANPHLARSLRARWARWAAQPHQWDGLYVPKDGIVRTALQEWVPSRRPWAATALELYARCPYRFYLRGVQRLAPREVVGAIDSLDAVSRGSIVHEVLYRVLGLLRAEGLLPVQHARLDVARAHAERIVSEVAARWHDELHPAIERIWDDDIAEIRDDVQEWIVRMADEPGWSPWRFELAFGLPANARADAASRPDPIVLPNGLVLRGAIDLVERRTSDGALRATDFKTGKVRARPGDVVRGGALLQPLLYAVACEVLHPGSAVEGGRLWYVTSQAGFETVDFALDAAARTRLDAVVKAVSDSLASANLTAAPADGECRTCDYRSLCGRVEEYRTGRKDRQHLAGLDHVRELP